MVISHCGQQTVMAKLFTLAFLVIAVNHTVQVSAQQAAPSPSKVSVTNLEPGTKCRVTMVSPLQANTHSSAEYTGTIKEVSKDKIVIVTGIREGRNEYATPILGDLPFVGKFFRHTCIGREEIAEHIPVVKVAAVELLESTK